MAATPWPRPRRAAQVAAMLATTILVTACAIPDADVVASTGTPSASVDPPATPSESPTATATDTMVASSSPAPARTPRDELPTNTPSSASSPGPATGDHRVTFVTGGGCFDADEPACPRFDADVSDEAWQALVDGALPPPGGVDADIGCGGEYVDGISVRVLVATDGLDPGAAAAACLSDADPAVGAAAELDAIHDRGREVVATAAWRRTRVRVEVGGGCAVVPDGCPDPVVRDVTDGPLLRAVADADLTDLQVTDGHEPQSIGSCGAAPVDGEGVLVTIRREAGGTGQTVRACLDDFDQPPLRDVLDELVDAARS